MIAAAVGDVLDLGFLGIAGFGVWRGQSLWSHHIELKHERELARLSMDRMEKSAKLEMEMTRDLAEMEQRNQIIAVEKMRVEGRPALEAGNS